MGGGNLLLRLRIRGFRGGGKSFLASGFLKQIIDTPFLNFGGLECQFALTGGYRGRGGTSVYVVS